MDNNQNNNYTNFNNYQPQDQSQPGAVPPQGGTVPPQPGTVPPQPGTVPPQPGTVPPQGGVPQQQMPYSQYPYQASPQPENKNKSLVLGIISIVLCAFSCCAAYLTSVPAAILGLIGVIRNKKSVVSWIGLILGVLLSIAWIGFAAYIIQNPEDVRAILEASGAYDQQTIDSLMAPFETIILSLFK